MTESNFNSSLPLEGRHSLHAHVTQLFTTHACKPMYRKTLTKKAWGKDGICMAGGAGGVRSSETPENRTGRRNPAGGGPGLQARCALMGHSAQYNVTMRRATANCFHLAARLPGWHFAKKP